jgi:type II secretory pathway pseudopilin PulG
MSSRLLSEVDSSGSPRVSLSFTRHSRKSKESGFSLVETVVVFGVIAITFSFAVTGTTSTFPRYKADAAMDQVVSQLRSARLRAISQRHDVQVQFSGDHQLIISDIVLKGAAPAPVTIDFEGGAKFVLVSGLPHTPMASGGGSMQAPLVGEISFSVISIWRLCRQRQFFRGWNGFPRNRAKGQHCSGNHRSRRYRQGTAISLRRDHLAAIASDRTM